MEIKKFQNLFVSSSGERQQRHTRPTPDDASFSNRLRDTADSFEALLARNNLAGKSDVTQSLYLAQMQAQKSALLDEYASGLARLSHDFSRQLASTGIHLSEIIDSAEQPAALNRLLSPLPADSRAQTEQFITTHQVQIHSLKLKNREIQNFPATLTEWLSQQKLPPAHDSSTAMTTDIPAGGDDASRYQQISERYQTHLANVKDNYNAAANALLMEAQRSLPVTGITLAELVHALEQPATGTDGIRASGWQADPALQQWLLEQRPLTERFLQTRSANSNIPSLADWARQNGLAHPWLHG